VPPDDRTLVDHLIALISSASELISLILDDEIKRISLEEVVDLTRLKALDRLKREFILRALIMQYVLTNVPKNPGNDPAH
jgi:hypothetical protein